MLVLRLGQLLAGSIILLRVGLFLFALVVMLPNMRHYVTPHGGMMPVVHSQSAEAVVRLLQKRSALILRNWLDRGAENISVYLRNGRIHFHARLGSDEPLLPGGEISEFQKIRLRDKVMSWFCPYLQTAQGAHGMKISVVTADLSDSLKVRLYRSSCPERRD